MKTAGEAAMELPWLAPNVASIATLTRLSAHGGPSVWSQVRTDPGFVLLTARSLLNVNSLDVALLEGLLHHQAHFDLGFIDWSQPGAESVWRMCCRQATLASTLAAEVGGDGQRAWIAGFLAPLGWLALTAIKPEKITDWLQCLDGDPDTASWQRRMWGLDHTALVRRLCRGWRLPSWLSSVLGNLGLPASIGVRLGADRQLLQVTQLALALIQEQGAGMRLPIGASPSDLLNELSLSSKDAAALTQSALAVDRPAHTWESPAKHPLLPELLRLALENRSQNEAVWIERLQQDLDHLQDALVQQCTDEANRLQTLKLSALAEFAAGAGHEINNPLAVISGQAQYVLKQMDWLDVPAEEIENVGEYLDNLREKVTPSLQKIVAQTQRVHRILTDLMQFARPTPPRLQAISLRTLIFEAMTTIEPLAQQRKVQLLATGPQEDEYLHADAAQCQIALAGLLRNAVEATPVDGWAKLRVEKKNGMIEFIVEDNGKGPCPSIRDHLFDPFFSGRSAGRGRGMGLPIAWRLARQHGGDVRFDGIHDGVTRFVLALPVASQPPTGTAVNGYHTEAGNFARPAAASAAR